jgi:uncharacterized RmlC-like cupin family protein
MSKVCPTGRNGNLSCLGLLLLSKFIIPTVCTPRSLGKEFKNNMARIVRIRTKPTDYKAQHLVSYPAIDKGVGSQELSMRYDIIPPRQRTSETHQALSIDSAIFVIKGQMRIHIGGDKKEEVDIGSGDFIFIPAGEPYYAENLSSTVSCEAVSVIPGPSFNE